MRHKYYISYYNNLFTYLYKLIIYWIIAILITWVAYNYNEIVKWTKQHNQFNERNVKLWIWFDIW